MILRFSEHNGFLLISDAFSVVYALNAWASLLALCILQSSYFKPDNSEEFFWVSLSLPAQSEIIS
jgi:hypothetical protein